MDTFEKLASLGEKFCGHLIVVEQDQNTNDFPEECRSSGASPCWLLVNKEGDLLRVRQINNPINMAIIGEFSINTDGEISNFSSKEPFNATSNMPSGPEKSQLVNEMETRIVKKMVGLVDQAYSQHWQV